jgi:hypothetical protein
VPAAEAVPAGPGGMRRLRAVLDGMSLSARIGLVAALLSAGLVMTVTVGAASIGRSYAR